MLPPTPTPLPAGVPQFSIPQTVSLWSSTSTAIQWWNWLGSEGQLLVQVLLIVLIVVLGLLSVSRWAKELAGKDSQE